MPQKDVNSMLADAKKTLSDLKVIPNPPAPSKPAGQHANAPYSMAKDIRDTGKSINYNLNQSKTANKAVDEETK